MLARSRLSRSITTRRYNDNTHGQSHANSIVMEQGLLARWSEGSNRFVMLHAEPCLRSLEAAAASSISSIPRVQ